MAYRLLHISTSSYQQQEKMRMSSFFFFFLVKTERMILQTNLIYAVEWVTDVIKMVFLLLELLFF